MNPIVEWKRIDYNIGNHFDGTFFTAPKTGLYYFSATVLLKNAGTWGYFFVNGQEKFVSGSSSQNGHIANLLIQTTLKLKTGDKVAVRYAGKLYNADYNTLAYFEGRFISKIDE